MFFKKTIAGITAFTTVAAMSGMTAFADDETTAASENSYKEAKLDTLVYSPDNKQTMDCRYYDSMPNIPYVKLSDYYKLWTGQDISIKDNNDGTYDLEVPLGFKGSVDTNEDQMLSFYSNFLCIPEKELTSDDFISDLYVKFPASDPEEIKALTEMQGIEDYMYSYDFGYYGIDLISDKDDVWFPVTTLCDTFYTGSSAAFYADDTLYFGDGSDNLPLLLTVNKQEHYDNVSKKFMENGRPQDVIDYNYNELCFVFDSNYIYPGRPVLTEMIMNNGIDVTLSEANATTKKIKEMLHSSDYVEYSVGFSFLNYYLWDGGHTRFKAFGEGNEEVKAKMDELLETIEKPSEDAFDYLADMDSSKAIMQYAKDAREEMIKTADYTESVPDTDDIPGYTYCEKGDTAFFSFDEFYTNFENWDKYYHNDGELPQEIITYFYKCLLKADENPEIKNFVIDMGANGGGYVYVLSYMMGVIADYEKYIDGYPMWDIVYENEYSVDKNFDKVIDEKDDNFKTDLRFGVISSNYAFSCANCLVSEARDNGIMIVGEKSGGGGCSVIDRLSFDGNLVRISAGTHFLDKDGKSIDDGITPDFENVVVNKDGSKDFSATYNFENLSKYFDEFYNKPESSETTTTTTTTDITVTTSETTAVSTESTTAAATETTGKTEESTTTSTATTSETQTTTTAKTEQKYFAPLSKMGDMAKADYKEKTGSDAADSVLKDNRDGTFSIILSDDKGNVLDTYTIDPATGKGKDSKGNDVDLPQTGNNSMKTAAAAAVAVTFMTVGAAAVFASGVGRKKEDN